MKEYLKSLPSSCSDPLPSFSEFIRNHHYRELLSYVGAIDRDSELTLQIMRRFGGFIKNQFHLRKAVEFVAENVMQG